MAEDLSLFVYPEAPVFDNRMPTYGNAFPTQGYIYPAGTLDRSGDGTLQNGDRTFPDLVIGKWTCDGYFIADGMRTETGAMVITRQVYRFDDGDLLISHAVELADPGVTVTRAVTGDYADAPAALDQVMLGRSDDNGVRVQIELDENDYGSTAIENDHTKWDSGVPVGPMPIREPSDQS